MKTTTKWILGIVIGLVVVTAVSALAIFAITQWPIMGWAADERSYMPRVFERTMPMHPYVDGSWFFMSRFNPLWFIGRLLLWGGLMALVVLGIISLVRMMKKPESANVPATAVSAPAGIDSATTIDTVHNCPACSRLVQQDWSHCPYCGHSLVPAA